MALPDPDACIYCQVPDALISDQVHHPECPTVTNLWPITPADVADPPMICPACFTPFVTGEWYTTVPSKGENILGFPGAVTAICLGCAALNREVAL